MGNCWSFQSNPEYYPAAVLDAHNYYRAHHLSPPLELDKDLCREASMHANLCAYHKKTLKSRSDKERGENIYSHAGKDAEGKEIKDSELWTHCYRAVNSWYESIQYHSFSESWKNNVKSHPLCYMLWKESRILGVGFARTIDQDKRKRITYIVCLYEPIPNPQKIGENVLIPAANLLPADKINERENEPEKKSRQKIKEVITYELREGWGFKDDLSNATDWKDYFSKNPWALKAFNDYVKNEYQRRAQLILKSLLKQGDNKGSAQTGHTGRRMRRAMEPINSERPRHELIAALVAASEKEIVKPENEGFWLQCLRTIFHSENYFIYLHLKVILLNLLTVHLVLTDTSLQGIATRRHMSLPATEKDTLESSGESMAAREEKAQQEYGAIQAAVDKIVERNERDMNDLNNRADNLEHLTDEAGFERMPLLGRKSSWRKYCCCVIL
ncbi:unnamed protein product [Allacma fusca]|uniref:SCP domain-containing protein n=1 Tax=Allacma fusca TaxID=39272 RepID=A0A8J2PE57_9HEXA|nr:unnamed protein product [Allacma fusca]